MVPLAKLKEIKDTYAQTAAIIEGGLVISYADLYLLARNCISNLIKSYSAHKFKRVVFIAENRYEMLVFMSAFSTLKVTFIGIDYTSSVENKINCIKSIDAECIVYTARYSKEVELITKSLSIITICVEKEFTTLTSKVVEQQEEFDWANLDRPFESISFTSGTSGIPKVVYRNKSFDARRFDYLKDRFKFTNSDIFLVTVPFYHVSVMGWARLFLNLGTTIVLGEINNPLSMADDIVRHKITVSLIVPNILDKIVKVFEDKIIQGELNLKFVIVGGKHFPINLKKRSINVFGPIVHEYYGSTETGINIIAEPEDLINIPESSGKTMSGSTVIILDNNNMPLSPDKKGRIAISSYQNMVGYLNAAADLVTLDDTQYIVTPDYGSMDENGYLYLTSRTSSDVNIYKLENMISQIQGIEDSYIFAQDNGVLYCVVTISEFSNYNEIILKVKRIFDSNGIEKYKIANSTIPYSMSGKVNLKKLKASIIMN